MKTCIACLQDKPEKEFGRSKFSSDGKNKRCKGCHNHRLDRMTDYERFRNKNLLYLYGIELEDYQQMLDDQGGLCKICFSEPTKEPLLVDHCHVSLKNRGLICRDCNTGLARLKDSPEILKSAINYLLVD